MIKKRRILSVSHIPDLGRKRENLLKAAGYEVKTVRTVVEAAAVLTRSTFDLVIIGHAVPHKETAAISAFIERARHVPVLFLYPGPEGQEEKYPYFDVAEGSEAFLKRVGFVLRSGKDLQ